MFLFEKCICVALLDALSYKVTGNAVCSGHMAGLRYRNDQVVSEQDLPVNPSGQLHRYLAGLSAVLRSTQIVAFGHGS